MDAVTKLPWAAAWTRLRWVGVFILAAILVRLPAITTLPIDWDEPVYMEASMANAKAIRQRNWSVLLQPTINPEHPGLVKLVYGVSLLGLGPDPDLIERVASIRGLSLVAGLGTVGLAAWVHPVAGLALAVHTIHAKYSVQGYLDSLPLLWMGFAMILGWRHRAHPGSRMMLLAAACWGAAIAGKWLHGMPGVVLLAIIPGKLAKLRFLVIALVCAVGLDPGMWMDPAGRVVAMIEAHQAYAVDVAGQSSYWAPLGALGGGGPASWHPEAFPFSLDAIWLLLGVGSMLLGWRNPWTRFLGAWFCVPLVFLVGWQTRWPQHAMVLVLPLCLAVGAGWDEVLSRASRRSEPTD